MSPLRPRALALRARASLALLVLAGACSPTLPTPGGEGGGSAALTLVLEPAGELQAAPSVLRLRVTGAPIASLDASDVHLAQGSLTAQNLEDLALGLPSEALERRLVPITASVDGEELWVIPHAALELGRRYSLAVEGLTFELRVASEAAPPLTRVFPTGPGPASVVACGAATLPERREATSLLPAELNGALITGSPRGRARACVRFEPSGEVPSGLAHLPPTFAGWALDPSPLQLTAPTAALPAACGVGERQVGLGCLQVQDDRAVLRGPSAETLWVVARAPLDLVAVTREGSRLVVPGLTPSSREHLELESISSDGVWRSEGVEIETLAPRPRPVLNEVYANALGPEPASEWVELVNDGAAPALLDGLVLEDVGGSSVIPEGSGTLEPGELALLVADGYDPAGVYDLPPAPGTRLIYLAELGGNGLSNQGEVLRLLDPSGAVLSTFPAAPKPRAGASVARVSSSADDGDSASFVIAEPPTPGAPYAPPVAEE